MRGDKLEFFEAGKVHMAFKVKAAPLNLLSISAAVGHKVGTKSVSPCGSVIWGIGAVHKAAVGRSSIVIRIVIFGAYV